MIEVLVLYLMFLLIVAYFAHKKDIMSPSVILIIVYILCISFSLFNWDIWNMDNYSKEATELIVLSVTIFTLVGIIMELFLYSKQKKILSKAKSIDEFASVIKINDTVLIVNIMICIVTVVWLLIIVLKTRGSIGLSNSISIENESLSIPFLLNILQRYVYIQGYFFSFVFMNNVINRKYRIKDFWILLFIFSTCFVSLLMGSRMEVLKIMACILIAGYILWRKKNGWDRNVSAKFIRIGFVSLCILIILFFQMKYFKPGDSSEFSPMYYISMYIGAPIKLFDLYIKNPIAQSMVWGKETFTTLHSNFVSLGLESIYFTRHLEFRGIDDLSLGNVYGAPRRFYQDFGVAGLMLLFIILSIIIHKMYFKIKYSMSGKNEFRSLLYCYLFPCIPMIPIDDIFFSQLSIGFLLNILFLYLLYLIIIKKKIVIKLRR